MTNRTSEPNVAAIQEMLHSLNAAVLEHYNSSHNARTAEEEVFLAAIAPRSELSIITKDDVTCFLPCYEDGAALLTFSSSPFIAFYCPAQVLRHTGKYYLTGPVVFSRLGANGEIKSVTTHDLYQIQNYLAEHSVTLMSDGQEMTCIQLD